MNLAIDGTSTNMTQVIRSWFLPYIEITKYIFFNNITHIQIKKKKGWQRFLCNRKFHTLARIIAGEILSYVKLYITNVA